VATTVSTSTGSSTLDESAVAALGAALRGPLIKRGDPGYNEARTIYNAMIDKHPALIAQCSNVADVIAAVNFARDNDVIVAIRGGGHNGPGLGLVDDGLVIDLSAMNGVRVDPAARTARVEGGALLGDLHHATNAFGLATPSGIISTTGVGGITLGGGMGHLTRQFGLAIDNLLEADVVLADGSFVTASEQENPDLFWALRGGGGNFGVVTSFLFKLHPIPNLYAGPMLWPLDRAAEVLSWYRDFLPQAPNDLNGFFAFITVASTAPFPEELWNQKMCGVVWAYTGDAPEEVFAPIRAQFGAPALDWVGPISHPALNSMFDGLYPAGDQWYWKADFVTEIPDEAVAIHVQYAEQLPTWKSTMHLYPIDGAAHRVGPTETPWGYRNANWGMVMAGVDPDPVNVDAISSWSKSYWEALHPFSAGGAYVNMMMEEGHERVEASYGENYERLAGIKAKYDPDNLFHVNQNIPPAG
jgi:hypothetical protein